MSDTAAARRLRLLENLAGDGGGAELAQYAVTLHVDERTVRRDVEYLQDILSALRGLEVRRGRVHAMRDGFAPGYFTQQLGERRPAKEAMARAVVAELEDNAPVVLTAGSTTFHVARALRRAQVEHQRPRNLMVFTNSLPALMELIAGGIQTGVIGEVYNPDDCAFHTHELRTAFHPAVAIVGASGIIAGAGLELFSDRSEEAAFMKQLLAPVPEIVIAADATKIGKRHPWCFTDGHVLPGKSVRLVTDELSCEQRESLDRFAESAPRKGIRFRYVEAGTTTGITEG